MGIYIDNGKTVKHYCTDKKTENAIITLLNKIEDISWSETHEGYCVDIKERKDGNDD